MKNLISRIAAGLKAVHESKYKQVIMVRDDLNLPKGKLAVQVAHASVEAALRSDKAVVDAWRKEGMKKVVVKVKNERELLKRNQDAKDFMLVTALITDAGKTVVEPGTKTCCAIGPAEEKDIDRITGDLKIL